MKHIYPKTSNRTSSTSVFHPWQHCLLLLLMFLTIAIGNAWGANVTWDQVAWGDITTSDVIIVTVTTSNGTYLLEHSQGTSATPKLGNTGTLTNSNTNCTFSENDNVKWKKDASNRLCKASDGGKWLYTGTSNNAMRVGTSTSGNVWSLDGDYIKSNASTARYLSVYGTTDFRSYTSKQSNQVTRFYKASSTPSYTITAQSNNNSYGTVSLSGNVITGSPNSGYTYGSPAYSVSPANSATVSQDGDAFTVTPSANTTVTINFEPIPTYTVTLSKNGTTSDIANCSGTYTLPTSGEHVANACDGWSWHCWANAAYSKSSPTTTAPSSTVITTMSSVGIAYAVYKHEETGGGSGGSVSFVFSDIATAEGWASESDGHNNITISPINISVTKGSSSYQGRWWSDNTWRIYSGNTITITSSDGDITAVTSTPSQTFSISNGVATLSASATIKFTQIDVTYGAGTSTIYTSSPNCVVCTNKVTVSKGTPSNGSFNLDKTGAQETCNGLTVTVTNINPSTGYKFDHIEQSGVAAGNVTINDNAKTVTYASNTTGSSTINVVFATIPTYPVTWSMDGNETNIQYYEEGASIVFPTMADGCDDKVFVGWSSEPFSEQDEVPETFVTSATMGTSPITYYAVYAEEETGSGSGGSGSGSGDYELVESAPANWAGDYLIAYSNTVFADGRVGGTDGLGKQNTSVSPGESLSGKVVAASWGDTYNVTIVESSTNGKYLLQTKDGKYNYQTGNSNGLASTANKVTAEGYPLTITFSSSSEIDIAIAAGAVLHYNTQGYFRFYKDGGQNSIYLYRKAGGSGGSSSTTTTYTGYTTSCGAGISAKSGKWITAAKGQKVKTVINVSARGFDAATTLSASSNKSNFQVSLAATAVPLEGLTTTLTVEYTPAYADMTEDAEITLTAGGETKQITVHGRSLPDEFLIITKKLTTWYALPANMTGGLNQYEGVEISPDNTTTPTSVSVASSTLVYTLKAVANARYADAGSSVRFVGNNKNCLYGDLTAGETGIQNSQKFVVENNTVNTDWLLTTTDGVSYTIANPNHADYAAGRQLAYGTKFGQYKDSDTKFYFVTTGCNSKPDYYRASARRGDVTFSWSSNATEMHIDVYKNGKLFNSATATSSPYTMTDLDQETEYTYKLTPDTDTDCAVTGTFTTVGPTIDVVEWKEDTVVLLVDKPTDLHPKIVIAGEQEHGIGTGVMATELFFSKYFEGSGDMKLVAIFNGTSSDISLADYSLYTKNCSAPKKESDIATSTFGSTTDYPIDALGTIKSGQEIILFTRPSPPDASSTQALIDLYNYSDAFLTEMAQKSGVDENPRWIECDNSTSYKGKKFPAMQFNGNDAVCLAKSGELIDVIGSTGDPGKVKNCADRLNDLGWSITVKNIDYGKASDDESFAGLYTASSKNPTTDAARKAVLAGFNIDLDNEYIDMTTARCILFRDKGVTSGAKAVALNTGANFTTAGNHTYQGENCTSEWNGRNVCMDQSHQTDAGVSNDSRATCNSYQDLGTFDYSNYYKDWTTISDDDNDLSNFVQGGGIETGTENLYEFPIDSLGKYTCLNLQFLLVDGEKELASTTAQVPILVKGEHSTTDSIFNQIMKKDNGDPEFDLSIDRCKTCEVRVLDGAILTKAADGATHDVPKVGNITIYPGGKLIVPNGTNYTVNTLTYRVEGERVPESELKGNLIMNNQQLKVTRRIKNDRYYFFSLPYDCKLSDVRWENSNTPAVLNTDFKLREYDGETRAIEGSYVGWPGHWKDIEGDVIKAGKGYNIAVSTSNPKELVFPMSVPKNNLTEAEQDKHTVDVPLEEYVGYFTALDDNWNLIAHPYLTSFDATQEGATNVEWETITRPDIDDPTQYPDSTGTQTDDIIESGTADGGIVWVLYADGSMELTGAGQMADYTSMDAVPWAQHRQFIQNLKIGGDVQKIGKYAFGQCTNLVNVIITASVTNLSAQAFAGCTELRTFRIESTQYISATTTTFDGISSLTMISLYVPQSMYDQYSQNTPWSKMAISTFDTGNPSPRRESGSGSDEGLYVYVPSFDAGKITYTPQLINEINDIRPFIAVFIQGSGRGSLTFTQTSTPAPVRRDAAFMRAQSADENASVFVGVVLNGNGFSDQTALRLRPRYAGGYKTGHDLLKFASFNTGRPQIYMHTDTCRLAFRAVSDKMARENWLPVGVFCRDAGTYTFSLNERYPIDEVEAVYLLDAETGKTTNLLFGSYTIETTQQLYTNTRFSINVLLRRKQVVDTPTMIDHTEDPNAPRKFLRDGVLYILRDGKIYDATGKPVQNETMLNR